MSLDYQVCITAFPNTRCPVWKPDTWYVVCTQIDLRKARERELATLDEQIDEPWDCWTLCAINIEARTGGEKG